MDQELNLLKEQFSNEELSNLDAPDDGDIPSQEKEATPNGDGE